LERIYINHFDGQKRRNRLIRVETGRIISVDGAIPQDLNVAFLLPFTSSNKYATVSITVYLCEYYILERIYINHFDGQKRRNRRIRVETGRIISVDGAINLIR